MIGSLNPKIREVSVIGGGIAGLLISHALVKKGYEVSLYESQSRLGGLIKTEMTPWGMAEKAAHSILASPPVTRLFQELNVELVPVHPNSKNRYIFRDKKMRRFPLQLGEFFALLKRAALSRSEESAENLSLNLEEWVQKFLGPAASENLLGPMMSGIYGSTLSEISVATAYPQLAIPFGESLLSWQIKKKLKQRYEPKPKRPFMMAPKLGMQSLVNALETSLSNQLGSRLYRESHVSQIPSQVNIVLTTPADQTSKLLKNIDPELSNELSNVKYTSLISVTLFIKKSVLKKIPTGVGVLMTSSNPSPCLGILFNSSCFLDRVSSPDYISLTVMLGGSRNPQILAWSDQKIRDVIFKELVVLFGAQASPEVYFFSRWERAIPQYNTRLSTLWKIARQGWCSTPGHILFSNYSGKVSIRGMIESLDHL